VITNIVAGVVFIIGAVNVIGGEKAILEVIQKQLKERPTNNKRISRHKASTIIRYIRTLFFLPFFGMERPIELDSYEGKTLGIITSPDGKHLKYRTTDRFLRDLTSLQVGDDLSLALAQCYFKTFYDIDEIPIYIDGHFKAVWTVKNIPRGKHGMMDRIMPGLKQVFLNGHDGHPLLHKTCPGDRHLTKEVMPIVGDFEHTIGKEVVNMLVIDGEGCCIDLFKEFAGLNKNREKDIHLLTVLDSNQYRFEDFKVRAGKGQRPLEDEDFTPFKRDKKGRVKSRVALVEFDYLSNANRRRKNGEEYLVRCAVVKKRNKKLTVMVTTLPYNQITSATALAHLYYNRWPCQEAKFKEMNKYCNLSINHGFKKKEVYNRLAANRLEKAEKSFAYDLRRLENLKKKYAGVITQINKRSTSMEKKRKTIEGQINRIEDRIRNCIGTESKQRRKLVKKNNELKELKGRYQEKIVNLKEKERGLHRKEKEILKSIEKNKTKVAKWKKELEETTFYEIETEMDHLMTNFKIVYENSLLYAKDTFFEGGIGIGSLLRQVVNHYGDLEILDEGNRFKFKLNKYDGKKLTKKVKRACNIFNEMEITTSDGIRLEVVVKR
jgi:hypothetical protein